MSAPALPCVMTVQGPMAPHTLGVLDAHNHVWIDVVPGGDPGAPVLDRADLILAELRAYRAAGGGALVDCQPGGCGRDGLRLLGLARASGVALIACTGFHRRRYYPPETELWQLAPEQAAERFRAELEQGLSETRGGPELVRAGYVKAACEARLADTPLAALEGAVAAALAGGAALAVHTERGQAVEELLRFCAERGLPPERLILFHVDKRPDFGLHRELAAAGVLLEYDTFYRPKYEPEANVWPLLARMAAAGLARQVALGTDMAETNLWRAFGGAPGLAGLLTEIRPRLARLARRGLEPDIVAGLLGGNAAARLAIIPQSEE